MYGRLFITQNIVDDNRIYFIYIVVGTSVSFFNNSLPILGYASALIFIFYDCSCT